MKEIQTELSDNEKKEYTKDHRDFEFQGRSFAEQRGSELGDEFTRLEVQIAAILLAFGGVFVDKIDSITAGLSPDAANGLRAFFALTILLLISSLALGLLQIRRTRKFWNDVTEPLHKGYKNWDNVLLKKKTFEEGIEYREELRRGRYEIEYAPRWTWILQTVFLGVSIMLISALLVISLFR